MASDVMMPPVSFENAAPMVGTRLLLCNVPKARSVEPADPKLYVSPVVLSPSPTEYVELALVSDSLKYHPPGKTEETPALTRLLKFSVTGVLERIGRMLLTVTLDV